ncbi:MAG: hypervirulence associated TUDOR domain-containing protein [Hasllibacter sp.]
MAYSEGDKVEWNWGNGTGTGEVKKKYTSKITKKISGSDVTRNATEDDPAYLIEQEDGDEVLKSGSELKKAA